MCICPYIYQSVACVCINAMHRGALYAYALRTDRAHFRRFRKSRSCFRNALPARYRIFFMCVCVAVRLVSFYADVTKVMVV